MWSGNVMKMDQRGAKKVECCEVWTAANEMTANEMIDVDGQERRV
jgi:hypothetical protein